jgi:hypothetical protein
VRKSLCLAAILSISTCFAADQLAEKWQKRINDAEANYAAAVAKADNARFFAVQKANGDRLKVLKSALSDATKSGDFDAATAFKEKVKTAELDGTELPDPAGLGTGKPLFLSALYGVNQSWLDVTDKLNQMVQGKKPVRFIVSDTLLGDPEPEFTGGNSLVTRYMLNGKIMTKAVYVGVEFEVP